MFLKYQQLSTGAPLKEKVEQGFFYGFLAIPILQKKPNI